MKENDKFKYFDVLQKEHILTYTGTRREVKGCMFEFFKCNDGTTCFFTDSEVEKFTKLED